MSSDLPVLCATRNSFLFFLTASETSLFHHHVTLFFSFLLDLPQILFAAVVRHSLNSFHTESTLPSDLSSAFNLTSSQYSALVSFCLSFHSLHLSIGLSFFFLGTDRLSSILHNISLCWVGVGLCCVGWLLHLLSSHSLLLIFLFSSPEC